MRIVVASLAALALAVPAGAHAQPVSVMGGAGPDTYLEAHLGAFLPQSSDIDALDPAIDLGLTFGARFSPNVAAEVELGWYRASSTSAGVLTALDAIPLTASLRLRQPFKTAEISVFAGGGVHFAGLHSEDEATGASFGSSSDAAWGYHVGAEVAFNLSPTIRLGFEARRTFVTADFDGAKTDIGGLRLAATAGWHF